MMTRDSAIMEEKHGKTLYKVPKWIEMKRTSYAEAVREWNEDEIKAIKAIKPLIMEDLHGKTPIRRA